MLDDNDHRIALKTQGSLHLRYPRVIFITPTLKSRPKMRLLLCQLSASTMVNACGEQISVHTSNREREAGLIPRDGTTVGLHLR